MRVEIAARCGNEVGESVLWDPEREEVLWVDIERGSILRLEPRSGAVHSSQPDDRIGAIGLREGGGLVLGLASGFALLDSIDGSLERLQTVESDLPTTRLNDGRVDRSGRFICGGMDEAANKQPISAVYRLDPDQQVHRIIDAVHISNSICFSPNGTQMYFTDMPSAQILVYSYDTDLGVPHDPKVFADLSDQPGLADGSTIDADGCLWNAQWGGGRIVRYTPSGAIDRVIELPATNPTCPAFGGSDLRTLFITTATAGLSEAQRRAEPDAGALFCVEVEAVGLSEPRFLG